MPDWDLLDAKNTSKSKAELKAELEMLRSNLGFAQKHIQVRDGIIEGAHAQLVIQNLHQKRLHETLHTKEKKKSSRQSRLFAGWKGCHLTRDEFMMAVDEVEQTKEDEENARSACKKAAKDRKSAKEANEEKWQDMLKEHDG